MYTFWIVTAKGFILNPVPLPHSEQMLHIRNFPFHTPSLSYLPTFFLSIPYSFGSTNCLQQKKETESNSHKAQSHWVAWYQILPSIRQNLGCLQTTNSFGNERFSYFPAHGKPPDHHWPVPLFPRHQAEVSCISCLLRIYPLIPPGTLLFEMN